MNALLLLCVSSLAMVVSLESYGNPSSGTFLEKVARLASTSINANAPPHGLLFWSIKKSGPGATSESLASSAAPAGYEHHPGLGSYKLHDYAASWCIANQICAEEGGHLMIVNSEAESEMAKILMAKYPTIRGQPTDHDWLWIGIHEKGVHGQFYTIFGEPLATTGFTRWDNSYPDKPGDSDCGLIWRKTGNLADNPCENQRGFICEHNIET